MFDDPPSVPCPPAEQPQPVLPQDLSPQKRPILVPSTPESKMSDLDSDSSDLLEDLDTASLAKLQQIETKDALRRLSRIDRRRLQTEDHTTVEHHFCMTMAKMLSTLPPMVKSDTMFRIHQVVYETQKQCLFEGHEDN